MSVATPSPFPGHPAAAQMAPVTGGVPRTAGPGAGRVPVAVLGRLSAQLQRSGRAVGAGDGWLNTLAVVAATVSTWMALLVAGGTWMFKERADAGVYQQSFLGPQEIGSTYVAFAAISCVFVVPGMISLIAQSAVLGAAGRERRLATLRLIGLSNRDVARMTMVETGSQTAAGLVLGTVLSMATAPFWALVSFQGNPIGLSELFLPWWGYPAVWAIILLLALGSALAGLARVLISPLGVSRRVMPRAMRWWRLGAFTLLVAAGIAGMRMFDPREDLAGAILGMGVVMFILIVGINIVAPLVIQVAAGLARVIPGAVNFVAVRRVSATAKESWRRVAAMTMLSVLLGYSVVMPKIEDDTFGDTTLMNDIVTGIILTFAIGLIVVTVSTLLTQASAAYEQASLTRALDHIGAPQSLHRRVAVKQTLWPLLTVTIPAMGFGMMLGMMMFTSQADTQFFTVRSAILLAVYIGSVALIAAAVLVVEPLRRSLLARSVRRND